MSAKKLFVCGALTTFLMAGGIANGEDVVTKSYQILEGEGKPVVESVEEKEIRGLEYQITNMEQEGSIIKFSANEKWTREKIIRKHISIPIIDEKYEITKTETYRVSPLVILSILEGKIQKDKVGFKEEKKLIERKEIDSKKKIEEEKQILEAEIIPVSRVRAKLSSDYFGFGEKQKTVIEINGDKNGNFQAEITRGPKGWLISEKSYVNETDRQNMGLARIRSELTEFGRENLKVRYAAPAREQCPIIIQLVPKNSKNFPESEYDEKSMRAVFNVKGFSMNEILPPEPFENWDSWIEEKLLQAFPIAPVTIRIRDMDSGDDIKSAKVKLKAISTPSTKDIAAKAGLIMQKYFKPSSSMYRKIHYNPNRVFSNLDGFNWEVYENISQEINIPSTYSVEITSPNYYFISGTLNFSNKSLEKKIYMVPKAETIRIETEKRTGKIVDE